MLKNDQRKFIGPKSMGAVDFLRDTLKTQHPEHSNGFSDLSEHPDYKNAGVKCFYYDGRLPLKILHDLNMRLINGGFKDSVVISR